VPDKETDTQGEGHVMMKAQTGDVQLASKPPEVGKSKERFSYRF